MWRGSCFVRAVWCFVLRTAVFSLGHVRNMDQIFSLLLTCPYWITNTDHVGTVLAAHAIVLTAVLVIMCPQPVATELRLLSFAVAIALTFRDSLSVAILLFFLIVGCTANCLLLRN